ncbi:MAG: hypothetical protein H6745_20385 [Deltaproteobacteria bacterium]|nr:hypothetical protein [Deltaproteobacteria bacterium]
MPTILFSTVAAAVLALIVWVIADALGAHLDLVMTLALSVGVTFVANVLLYAVRRRKSAT